MIERPESIPIWPPTPGYYAMALVKDGPLVPVRIWHGLPVIDDEEQDRAPRWLCEIAGRVDYWEKIKDDPSSNYRCKVAIDITRAWPFCARRPIDEPTYRYMLDHAEWSRAHKPDNPDAEPWKPVPKVRKVKEEKPWIDLNAVAPIF